MTNRQYRQFSQYNQFSMADTQPHIMVELDDNGQSNGHAPMQAHKQLANVLGWFSLGLGLAQLVMPDRIAELIGIRPKDDHLAILRGIGLRELVSGIGIQSQPRPLDWVRARVAGDVMDLALLGTALNSDDTKHPERLTAAATAIVGISILDVLCSEWLRHDPDRGTAQTEDERGLRVKQSITVNRPIEEVYSYWHNFENLPHFMSHLESVTVLGGGRSHWVTKAPAGRTVEWDAEMIDDTPNQMISWRSLEGATVSNNGTVRFEHAPADQGTEIRVEMHYDIPAGKLGAVVAKMFGESPDIQVADDLRAFKQVMETGQIVRSDSTVTGNRLLHRPAQPPRDPAELMVNGEDRREMARTSTQKGAR